ncbi:heme exporter protein CcmB [Erythrobacter sp. SD-21]|uniref:heme exporter protein CcmB n=1 Tax=Erythrobacter sp. SD-21 TaxID=161528 RepID=UPI000153FD4A|nr:heme exporter protein CcmB [Erythrobacter sp. SD-21]EDL48688.1 ABC-type transport system permease component [Erythrobacter sp. SD-21]
MSAAITLLRRDLGLLLPGGSGGGGVLPLLFFLAVAMLYPFAVGPDAQLLARTGGGVIWVAALLAAILPLEKLVASDLEAGVFDQLHLRGISEELAMMVRLAAHWLAFAPLLLLATLPAAALLGLTGETTRTVLLGLMAGTPGLAAVGLAVAALTAAMRGGAALAGLMVIPLAVPILIFGAGALGRPDPSALLLTASISLGLVALAPFAAAAAIRAARET